MRTGLEIQAIEGLPEIEVGTRLGELAIAAAADVGLAPGPGDVLVISQKAVSKAEGRVRAQMAGQFPGLNLTQGLSGVASCDGEALLLPLVSQSGLEKVNLRIWRSGRYVAEMRVETADAVLGDALAKAGFAGTGGARELKVEGTL